jgi:hypothetical protein
MKTPALIPLIFLIFYSCHQLPDLEKEKQEILVLHNKQRKAHLEKNVSLLTGDSSIEFMEINRGLVKTPSTRETEKKFQAYFNAVDFIKWDDVKPPVFQFSDDGTMATTIVEKLVITRQKQDNNRMDTTYFAWLSVYRKIKGKWHLQAIASTNR